MAPVTAYEVSDDPTRVDRDVVWGFLSTEAYWGRWRDRATVEGQLDAAWRQVGAYAEGTGEMVGFARAFSDGFASAYLADVFVLPAHRGRGVAQQLVRAVVEEGPRPRMRWMLHTRDMHGLYTKFGFAAPDATYLERPARF